MRLMSETQTEGLEQETSFNLKKSNFASRYKQDFIDQYTYEDEDRR